MKKSILLISTLLTLAGCESVNANDNVIYASFYPLYDFANRIAGDLFEIKILTPPGAEPHDYELTTSDLRGLSSSKGLLLNGLGIESWSANLPSSIASKTTITTKNISPLEINGVPDPHVWLNPLHAISQMEVIKEFFISIDNSQKLTFESNFERAKNVFLAMDRQFEEERQSFAQTYFAVNHAAFGYLADRYDLHQVYVSGLSPEEEPSAQDMERIAQTIKEHNITTIFTEEFASSEVSEAIARETGAKLDTLNPLEGLSNEEMKTKDYIAVMKENFSKLKEACK